MSGFLETFLCDYVTVSVEYKLLDLPFREVEEAKQALRSAIEVVDGVYVTGYFYTCKDTDYSCAMAIRTGFCNVGIVLAIARQVLEFIRVPPENYSVSCAVGQLKED